MAWSFTSPSNLPSSLSFPFSSHRPGHCDHSAWRLEWRVQAAVHSIGKPATSRTIRRPCPPRHPTTLAPARLPIPATAMVLRFLRPPPPLKIALHNNTTRSHNHQQNARGRRRLPLPLPQTRLSRRRRRVSQGSQRTPTQPRSRSSARSARPRRMAPRPRASRSRRPLPHTSRRSQTLRVLLSR